MPEHLNIKLREPATPPAITAAANVPPYAELETVSNFSFLRGASHPDELVFRAAELGYRAIAITDINSLAGVVRAYAARKELLATGSYAPQLVIGARLTLDDGPDLLVWPTDRPAYARLCRLLTLGKRRAQKGECFLQLQDVLANSAGLLAAVAADVALEQCNPALGAAPQDPADLSWHGLPARVPRYSAASSLPLPPGEGRGEGHASHQPPADVPEYRHHGLEAHATIAKHNISHSLSLLHEAFGPRLSLAAAMLYRSDDVAYMRGRLATSRHFGIPLLATNHVHYHLPGRRPLQDVLVCVREGCTIHDAGFRLFANAERYLKSPEQMHRLFADCPSAIARSLEIAEQCTFSLDELRYEYPDELSPPGMTPQQYLTQLAWEGATERYAPNDEMAGTVHPAQIVPPNRKSQIANRKSLSSVPENVRLQIEHELRLIEELNFASYFLTVYDIVRFARSRGILCQGRGSAANSAVCYCIGVTSVDPDRIEVLFERFVSAARGEPPDIDVDFEHERREEVLQYIYDKYGRDRAGMTAEVITYRGRSAVRDIGKALGLSLDLVDSLAKKLDWWHRGTITESQLRELGLSPEDPTIRQVVALTQQALGFPRHLSQHVGGMVMTRGSLCELVPIENAAMPGRTVIEWDKDDIDTLGILKVDVLGLGMLTCISKALALINQNLKHRDHRDLSGLHMPIGKPISFQPQQRHAQFADLRDTSKESLCSLCFNSSAPLELHTIPPEDPAVYEMLAHADTIGVFQIESRAQMSMLPRLRP
ncbi:MAG: PHP domain-containing protein, partial [Tepidisphaerales bacterium]